MRLPFGFEISIRKAAPTALQSVDNGRGWFTVFDSTVDPTFAFQQDIHVPRDQLDANWAVFACKTLIAGDIAKLRMRLMEQGRGGVWVETVSPQYAALLRKPNGYQTWQQLTEYWQLSKQSEGNAIVLLERDGGTRVNAMHVLDWARVTPLVAPDGSVYYRLQSEDLAGIPTEDGDVVVPASEVIHDRMNCMFHPLVGLSPLFASWLAASVGITIQKQSQRFFKNSSRPGGMLVSAQTIPDDLAKSYKKRWEENYGAGNEGRTAVLGNGLKYEPIATNAVDSELVAQLRMSAEMICSTFHVPAYKVGVGVTPTYANAEILNQIYYDACLQKNIKSMEVLLDEALELRNVNGRSVRASFDLDDLLRMDSATMTKVLSDQVKAGIASPNEARARLGFPPAKGGDEPILQQQNWPLSQIAERPPAASGASSSPPPASPTPANDASAEDAAAEEAVKAIADYVIRELEYAAI